VEAASLDGADRKSDRDEVADDGSAGNSTIAASTTSSLAVAAISTDWLDAAVDSWLTLDATNISPAPAPLALKAPTPPKFERQ
jgi:hypothetical protein